MHHMQGITRYLQSYAAGNEEDAEEAHVSQAEARKPNPLQHPENAHLVSSQNPRGNCSRRQLSR